MPRGGGVFVSHAVLVRLPFLEWSRGATMSRSRLFVIVAFLLIAGAAIAYWAVREARVQRIATERALRDEVEVLAGSLGPSVAAAASAVRELEEIITWKLLDNARLLARLDVASKLDAGALAELAALNGLDTIVILDRNGDIERQVGAPIPGALDDARFMHLVDGRMKQAILNWSLMRAEGRVGAAVARAGGGAVLVTTDRSIAFAYARRLGVANLLRNTVGTGRVLFLSYDEHPDGAHYEASWDGQPVPPLSDRTGGLYPLRGRRVFEIAAPVDVPSGDVGLLRVGLDGLLLDRAATAAMRRTVLVGSTLAALGLVAIGFAMVVRARALEREESIRRVADLERRQRREERLAAAGTLAAGVAHEIRNPLNAISLAAQRLERSDAITERCRGFAGTIRNEVRHLEDIVQGFLDLARPPAISRAAADIVAIVDEVVRLLDHEASARRVHLMRVDGPDRMEARVDREAVRRAVLNLLRNAIEVSPSDGRVEITVARTVDGFRIEVADQGDGIDPSQEEQLFDAFFTTRANGTGLGLPLVRRVAVDHGGWASLENRDGGGARAILDLNAGQEDDA